MIPPLRAAFLSDLGRMRSENQDRCLLDDELGLYGVADGVGGLPGGGQAAETAVNAVVQLFRQRHPGAEPDPAAIVAEVHRRVSEAGQRVSPLFGIATTLTFGWRTGDRLVIAHIGDSRCYRWRGGRLDCLTEDHSVENLARSRGEVCPPAHRLALVRCVGQPPAPPPDVIDQPLTGGERYLFCTDGICRVVSDREIGGILGRPGSPGELLHELVALALRRGGPDNASGVLVFVDEG